MQNLNLYHYLKVKNNHSPLLFNSVLWSLIFITLLIVFTKGHTPIKVDLAYTVVFTLFLTLPVVLNFYILIPRFLKNERYLLYVILFILIGLLSALMIDKSLHLVLDSIFPNLFFISYPAGINYYIITSVVLVASTLLKLAEDWFYFNTNENRVLRLKNTQVETQLSVLRAQINPHFLFNSLNVIYALALENSNKITQSIILLSDILRYVLYDTNVERVPLHKEVDLLKNYIEFQKVRYRDQHKVGLNIQIENDQYKIYPMLLLPLIENTYKHGDFTFNKESGYMAIDLYQTNNKLTFSISNSFSNKKEESILESSGIGLENIKSNLELVYPDCHTFTLHQTADEFKIQIEITEPLSYE